MYRIIANKTTGYVDVYYITYYIYNYGPVVTGINTDCSSFAFIDNDPKYIMKEMNIVILLNIIIM